MLLVGTHLSSHKEVDGGMRDGEDMVSNDDLEEEVDGPWFSMEMSKAEKIEARKPWKMSLIIKLVGRSIGYRFLLRRMH